MKKSELKQLIKECIREYINPYDDKEFSDNEHEFMRLIRRKFFKQLYNDVYLEGGLMSNLVAAKNLGRQEIVDELIEEFNAKLDSLQGANPQDIQLVKQALEKLR